MLRSAMALPGRIGALVPLISTSPAITPRGAMM
jgi:hypothetical protein